MMTRARQRVMGLIAITAVFSFGVAVTQGCGSDSFTATPSTDGGNVSEASVGEAGSTDSGVADGSTGCLTLPPSIPSGDTAFCGAFAEVYDRCGSCETCRQEDVSNCAAIGDALSGSFKAAIVSCKDSLDCTDLQSQTIENSACVSQIVLAGTPTLAQAAAKTAYCTACAGFVDAGAMPCDQFFELPDGGPNAGAAVLYFNEKIASDVTANCASPPNAVSCNPLFYLGCEGDQLCKGNDSAPKTTCAQGLCKSP